jgi:hypothetical protein
MLRRTGLALVLIVSMLSSLPLATSLAHNLRLYSSTASHRRNHHSRAWWRRHRARVRHRLAMIARRRAALLAAQNGNASAISEPKALLISELNAFAISEPKALPISEPKALAISEPKVLAISEPKALAISEPKALAISEPRAQAIPGPKALAISEPKAMAIPELRALAIPEPRVLAISELRALAIPEPRAQAIPEPKASGNHVALPSALSFPEGFYRAGSLTLSLPDGWSPAVNSKSSSVFRIAAPNGMPTGNATLSVVAIVPANVNQPIGREQRRMLGGVSFTDLRRTVIDRMIGAGGWVVNDRVREIGGHRVFQVIAQTPASTPGTSEQIWNFYFTEINGRVYSLATRAGGDMSDKLTVDVEKFLSSFNPMTNPTAVKK